MSENNSERFNNSCLLPLLFFKYAQEQPARLLKDRFTTFYMHITCSRVYCRHEVRERVQRGQKTGFHLTISCTEPFPSQFTVTVRKTLTYFFTVWNKQRQKWQSNMYMKCDQLHINTTIINLSFFNETGLLLHEAKSVELLPLDCSS